jgi:hypothetical protein
MNTCEQGQQPDLNQVTVGFHSFLNVTSAKLQSVVVAVIRPQKLWVSFFICSLGHSSSSCLDPSLKDFAVRSEKGFWNERFRRCWLPGGGEIEI